MGQSQFKYVLLFKRLCKFKRLPAVSPNILKTVYAFHLFYFSLDKGTQDLVTQLVRPLTD